jgi:hypothetical protein
VLSVLAGHWRYAHMTTLRCDPVNPRLPWILDIDTTVKPLYGHQEGYQPSAGTQLSVPHLNLCRGRRAGGRLLGTCRSSIDSSWIPFLVLAEHFRRRR